MENYGDAGKLYVHGDSNYIFKMHIKKTRRKVNVNSQMLMLISSEC